MKTGRPGCSRGSGAFRTGDMTDHEPLTLEALAERLEHLEKSVATFQCIVSAGAVIALLVTLGGAIAQVIVYSQ